MHLLVADSWLTVGVTDGTPDTVSSVGIDFSEWSNTQGIEVTQGSVFWLDLDKAPKKGGRDITIAQLTVPAGASFDGKVNAQGSTVAGAKSKHWDARNIAFHGGPEKVGKSCNAPADCPSCEDPMVRTCGKSNTCSCKLKHCTGTSCCSTCKRPPPPGPKSPKYNYYKPIVVSPACTSLAEFTAINARVTKVCCDQPTESCRTGVPATCNAGCAAVLVPAKQACTSPKGFLTLPSMAVVKRAFTTAAAKCAPVLSACTSLAEFTAINARVTKVCCDQPTESCRTGVPATCNAGCAAVLVPAKQACTSPKGFLTLPSMVVVKRAFTTAAAKCAPQH